MTGMWALIRRNTKLYFKDKGMFFTSLITPVILLVLYATFLAKVYKESFLSALPAGVSVEEGLLNATVGGQLVSSLLAVSCVTVAFCSNLLMVQDKISGARRDLTVTPVRRPVLAGAYFASCALSTLIVNFGALGVCLLYLGITGWYLTLTDVGLIVLDVVLLTLFGVALSSCVNSLLSTQGQASAVGTVVSAGYGFLCGAYMPISSFSEGLQKVMAFLPGNYGTSLLRNHALAGAYREMADAGFPEQVIEGIKDSVDCNLYFFGKQVSLGGMYAVLCGAIVVLTALMVLLYALNRKDR